jgi:catechol 2,3-dioxygenase-like lactoylglutathione lyase family enzyme
MYTIKTSNVTIMVNDMDKSIDFYTTGLGLELKQRWNNHYAQVAAPGVVIGLHPAKATENPTNSISIGFGVDSLAEAEKRLKELNVHYETAEDKTGKIAHFKDPDGTLLYFMESSIDW